MFWINSFYPFPTAFYPGSLNTVFYLYVSIQLITSTIVSTTHSIKTATVLKV